ncbi:MAG: hypothetical protein FWE98_01120 [Oscillospiraceae bacterium]|nr:hypothetical protein [Oscillospiraceae bacterium]
MTVYGALYVEDLYTEGLHSVQVFGVLIEPTMTATASIIGKTYPLLFVGWGVFQSIALTLNVLYLYRRYGYKSKAGYALLALGTLCIISTVFIRSTEEPGLQRTAHWATALLFAFLYAIAMGMCLLSLAKKSRKFLGTFIFFVAMLALMLALLIFVGKGGAIESIPMWGVYVILLLTNFTGMYKESLAEPIRNA